MSGLAGNRSGNHCHAASRRRQGRSAIFAVLRLSIADRLWQRHAMWILAAVHRVVLAALFVALAFAPVGAATLRDTSDQAMPVMAQMSAVTDCDLMAKVQTGCAKPDCDSAAACAAHCGLTAAVFALSAEPAVFQAFSSLVPVVVGRPVLFGPLVPDPRPPRA